MAITINGSAQDRRLVKKALDDVRKIIDTSDKIPQEKKDRIKAIMDDANWHIAVDLPFGGSLNGSTSRYRKRIRLSLNTFSGGINRFRAVIFHELVHATGEGEFDAEVFENLVFPPSKDLPRGGTWPNGDDVEPFDEDTSPIAGGLRESDHFIWNPTTGQVWKRNHDGSRGPIVWEDPRIWDKWKTVRTMSSAPVGSHEAFIDYVEEGDYGYLALDQLIVRPPLNEVLLSLDNTNEIEKTKIDFIDFIEAKDELPVSLVQKHITKIVPDKNNPDSITNIRLINGEEINVKLKYSDVINRLI